MSGDLESAGREDQSRAHTTSVAILSMWLGRKTRSAVASELELPPLRVWQLSQAGLGQSTCVGIGGDAVLGSSFPGLLRLFQDDPETEASLRLTIAGILLLISALLYRVPLGEFLLLCVAVSVLWVTEMINTSMEMFVDHASGGAHQTQVKRIKDISAGAVLIAAVNAAIIGSAILCPRVLSTLRSP